MGKSVLSGYSLRHEGLAYSFRDTLQLWLTEKSKKKLDNADSFAHN